MVRILQRSHDGESICSDSDRLAGCHRRSALNMAWTMLRVCQELAITLWKEDELHNLQRTYPAVWRPLQYDAATPSASDEL